MYWLYGSAFMHKAGNLCIQLSDKDPAKFVDGWLRFDVSLSNE